MDGSHGAKLLCCILYLKLNELYKFILTFWIRSWLEIQFLKICEYLLNCLRGCKPSAKVIDVNPELKRIHRKAQEGQMPHGNMYFGSFRPCFFPLGWASFFSLSKLNTNNAKETIDMI